MIVLRGRFPVIRCLILTFLAALGQSANAFFDLFVKSPEPSSVAIKLNEVGVVADFKFQIKKQYPYLYSMRFHFSENDQVERKRIRELLGGHAVDKNGKPIDPGRPTPIKLRIFIICSDGKEIEVYSKDADPIMTSWGNGWFGKNIGGHIMIPGVYRAHITNMRSAPEFGSIPITFEIGMPAKIQFDSEEESDRSSLCQK